MKANKSPDATEVTPSKKKLKQARLPFMLISDVSPKAAAPQGRKRKLSAPDVEPVTKVGKISKENDDLVVISDDEGNVSPSPQKDDKPLNPYVKLVDTAWKKKLQKGKTSKKAKQSIKKLAKGKNTRSKSNVTKSAHDKESTDTEMVEVEVQIHEENTKNNSENLCLLHGNKEELTTDLPDNKEILVQESEIPDIQNTRSGKSSNKDKSSPKSSNITPITANTTTKNSPEKPVEISPTTTKSLKESIATSKLSKKCKKPSPTDTNVSEKPQIMSIDDSDNSADVSMTEPIIITEGNHDPEQTPDIEHCQTEIKEQKTDENIFTPKRSARNKAKAEETNSNTSIISAVSSKLDESMCSAPGTPNHNKSSANLDESMNDSIVNLSNVSASNLTPKQVSYLTLFLASWFGLLPFSRVMGSNLDLHL